MSRLFRLSLVLLLVLNISAPTWAFGGSNEKHKRYYQKSKKYSYYFSYARYQKWKTWLQYRRLMRAYDRAGQDARQKFLGKIGMDQPDVSGEIQRIREEYEQQIAQLNSTIASNEEQIAELNSTIASNGQQIGELNSTIASNEQRIAELNNTVVANEQQIIQLNNTISSHNQQLAGLRAEHQEQLVTLEADWRRQADEEYERGLEEGRASCEETPSGTGAHAMINSWNTEGFTPDAIDVDGAGNVYILDNEGRAVVRYDTGGNLDFVWGSSMFQSTVDLATNSQGEIFILDQESAFHLQKYNRYGTWVDLPSELQQLVAPTGFFIDASDTIYVADSRGGTYGGSRILVFHPAGDLMMQFGDDPDLSGEVYRDIAVNPQDQSKIVLTDTKVVVFDQNGNYVRDWQGNFSAPSGLVIGGQGEIYVVDSIGHQVFEYDQNGTLIDTFGAADLVDPGRQGVDANGLIYVGDKEQLMIKVFQ